MGDSDTNPAVQLWALHRLIAGVCHEINNPLTAVQGLAELLTQEESDPQKREDLEVITQESTRAISVVRNLRTFARTPEGEPIPCAVNSALSQVVDTRGYETRARGLALETAFDPSVPAVLCHYEDLLLMGLLMLLEAESLTLTAATPATTPGQEDDNASIVVRTAGGPEALIELEVRGLTVLPSSRYSPPLEVCASVAQRIGGRFSVRVDNASRLVTYSLSLPAAS